MNVQELALANGFKQVPVHVLLVIAVEDLEQLNIYVTSKVRKYRFFNFFGTNLHRLKYHQLAVITQQHYTGSAITYCICNQFIEWLTYYYIYFFYINMLQ